MPDHKPRLSPTSEVSDGDAAPGATMASPSQCRAGRAMLGLAQAEFARCAGVTRHALAEYERGRAQSADVPRRITETLHTLGVALTKGDGVQLAEPRPGRTTASAQVRAPNALSLPDPPACPDVGRPILVDVNPAARTAAPATHRRMVLRFRQLH